MLTFPGAIRSSLGSCLSSAGWTEAVVLPQSCTPRTAQHLVPPDLPPATLAATCSLPLAHRQTLKVWEIQALKSRRREGPRRARDVRKETTSKVINPMFPLRGPLLTPFFSFRSAPQSAGKGGRAKPDRAQGTLQERALLGIPLPETRKDGKHLISAPHCTNKEVGPSEKRRQGRNTRATELPVRKLAPPGRPSAGSAHCLSSPRCPAGPGAPWGPRTSALWDPRWPQHQPGPPPACPLSIIPARGFCGLTCKPRAEPSSSGTSSRERMRTTPGISTLRPPGSTVSARAAAGCHLTEDPRPGTAPRRLRPAPRPAAAEPRTQGGGSLGPSAAA